MAPLGRGSGQDETEAGFKNKSPGLIKELGIGSGEREKRNPPESRILTFGAPFPSFVDDQELATCGWLRIGFLNNFPLSKEPFHQSKRHRGSTIFPERLTEQSPCLTNFPSLQGPITQPL